MKRLGFWLSAVILGALIVGNLPSCAHAQSVSIGKGAQGPALDVQLGQHFAGVNSVLLGKVFNLDSLALLPEAGLGSRDGYGGAFGLKAWYDRGVHLRLEAEKLAGVDSKPGRSYTRLDVLGGNGAYLTDDLIFRSGLSVEVRDSTGARAQALLGPTLSIELPEHRFFGNHIRFWHGFGLRKGSRGTSWVDVSLFF